jgi:predicted glutamine amidotransferase
MCIAILNPNNVTLKKKVLKTCWENNTDGAGMLYLADGKLTTHKEMSNFDSFYDHYANVRKQYKSSQVVIHFRISTHGKVNLTNCHPFIVNDDWGFVHNGIISAAPKNEEFSDTYMFNREILQKLPTDWIHNDAIYDLVQDYIGSSKLLFLNQNNEAFIVNEDWGVWDLGCWFSNTTYKASRYYDYGGTKVYKGTSTAASTITPTTSTGRWNSWDDDDLESWNDSFDYKWNDATKKYDRVTIEKEEEFTSNPWDKKDELTYDDQCESCMDHKECRYDYGYECSVCKECADSIHQPF